ncbi:MAG: RNA methyltransferase [Leptolyngbyaceae cyanobacterium T60_A2020_046]|nr:RNA methyltransferase [Leptolyngbyaceae cyanobacterium T60_A2020_046]
MLTSVKNPLVKHIKKLHQGKYRRSQQEFLLEGTHLIQEALNVAYPLTTVCLTPDWQTKHPELSTQLQHFAGSVIPVSPEVLAAIATTVTPDGIVAIAPFPVNHATLPLRPSLAIAFETLQDPGNLGTVIRTAAAVGCDGLWLSANSVDPFHPKVLRASSGQWFRVPIATSAQIIPQISEWQAHGCQVLATCVTDAQPYWNIDLRQPTVILLGNEGAGLSEAALQASTQRIHIPMATSVESLNVGVAAAVILFEAARQRAIALSS